jgi:hypothetical protein
MAPDRNLSVPSVGRMLDRLRLGGKKTAVAGALMLVMLFMWTRVFIGHRPAAAAAAPAPAATPLASAPRETPVRVMPVDLPKMPGRHDSIERDFFTIRERTAFRRGPAGRNTGTEDEVSVVSTDRVQEVIQRVAKTMKLDAVLQQESPGVYINDRLLGVGGKFPVKDGAAVLEFEVLRIDGDAVLVGCEGIQLTLKLAQNLEGTK